MVLYPKVPIINSMYVMFPGRNFNSILLVLRSDSEAFIYYELVDSTSIYKESENEGEEETNQRQRGTRR